MGKFVSPSRRFSSLHPDSIMTQPVDIVKESVTGPIFHGHVDVGTAAVQLTSIAPPAKKGVIVRADAANTVDIYIGNAFVTANNTAASGGIPIAPGEALFIPVDNPSLLYARASAVSQDLAWLAV